MGPIYVMGLMLKHIKQAGGVESFEKLAAQRSTMLYEFIDNSGGYYKAPVDPACRSRFNHPFLVQRDAIGGRRQALCLHEALPGGQPLRQSTVCEADRVFCGGSLGVCPCSWM